MGDFAFLIPASILMVSMTLTPGPNNVMLTASGANFGFRRTIPHILGILGGCFVLFAAIGLGLGSVFERYPSAQRSLGALGSAYLLYLAWRIASAAPPSQTAGKRSQPLKFWEAAAFQFANPKAWIMGSALMSGFLPPEGDPRVNAFLLATASEVIALPCISLWAAFGTAIGKLLASDGSWRKFNRCMGCLTAVSVVTIWL